ncbi:HupE/UreJ family protein [Luteolibacter yonseiensis]
MNGRWFLHLLIVFLLGAATAHAHRNRIESVTITELTDQRYEIRYDAPPPGLSEFAAPVLPGDCRWVPLDAIPQSEVSTSLVFEANNRALGPDDRIILPWQGNGVLVTMRWRNGNQAREYFRSGAEGIIVRMGMLHATDGSMAAAAGRFTRIGFEHISGGLDHLLFIAGLLLLVNGKKRLFLTITAFTIAHSLTLALAALGVIHVPGEPVEAIIALSILLLAVEGLAAKRGRAGLTSRWPWLVSGGFGLIHGLAFAGALGDLGLTRTEIAPALLFFNLGVEAGQLLFAGACLLILWPLRAVKADCPASLRLSGHYVLGILSAYWFLERTVEIFQ